MEITRLRVNKNNELVSARLSDFKMSATQNRIIAWMASLVHSRKDTEFNEVRTTVNQLNEITRHKYSRSELEWDLRDLRKATAVIREGSKSIICGIIDSAKVDMDTGEVILKLGLEMKPYLLKLGEGQQGFTSYMLEAFLQIKSANSQRLFEVLTQWKTRGEVKFELNELKRMMSLCEEVKRGEFVYNYPQWRDFERRVLRQAEEDLCNAGMHVFYYPIKTGRKVTHVEFRMTSNAENMDSLKTQYKSLFMYDLSDYQRMRIAYSNNPAVVLQAMIDCDKDSKGLKEKDLTALKKLLPKSRAEFYKKFAQVAEWKESQEVKKQEHELF